MRLRPIRASYACIDPIVAMGVCLGARDKVSPVYTP